MLLLPFVPIMALIIQNGLNMVNVLQYQYEMQETIDQVRERESPGVSRKKENGL